ncbi:hypothetical protein [Haemophilus haemolyticus]|uniref:hypothetical protein n=1 Tax=Haemophilus haemolyticus TaxID=726 RepID=UPI000E57F4D8|nr:hypothetical protein [Haemophilus haemolyticus]
MYLPTKKQLKKEILNYLADDNNHNELVLIDYDNNPNPESEEYYDDAEDICFLLKINSKHFQEVFQVYDEEGYGFHIENEKFYIEEDDDDNKEYFEIAAGICYFGNYDLILKETVEKQKGKTDNEKLANAVLNFIKKELDS